MVYGDRLMRLLAEEALCRLPSIQDGEVITPCGVSKGLVEKRKMDICLVSVVRSGKLIALNITMSLVECSEHYIFDMRIFIIRRHSPRGCQTVRAGSEGWKDINTKR